MSRTCIACGRVMPRVEGNVSGVGDLCHPDDPSLRDCYHRWTVYGERTRYYPEWSPELPCGGISVNGAEPPLCEVHMKPWGHRRKAVSMGGDTPDYVKKVPDVEMTHRALTA